MCFSFGSGCGARVLPLWRARSLSAVAYRPRTHLQGAAVHAKASVELLPAVVDLARPLDGEMGELPVASRAGRMVLIIGFAADDGGFFVGDNAFVHISARGKKNAVNGGQKGEGGGLREVS